jgi:hypothetical protein
VIVKRLFPLRWARITVWTGAALAWGTSAVAVAASMQPEDIAEGATEASVEESSPTTTTTTAPLPAAPPEGLVVIRYSPVPAPPPETIVRTVTVSADTGNVAPPAAEPRSPSPAKSPQPAKASTPTASPPPPPPPTTVPSQGS